jgi:hypothetical protein
VVSLWWLIPAVVLAVLLTLWVTMTTTRLDRLHARVDAAGAALDAQLVRRAAAVRLAADSAEARALPDLNEARRAQIQGTAERAIEFTGNHEQAPGLYRAQPEPGGREAVENTVGRMLTELADHSDQLRPETVAELREAAARVQVARRFYNDAVRDTRSIRSRRMPRLLRLAGHRPMPEFFDIDDTLVADAPRTT